MTAEELSNATARFYRGKNSVERGSGLGLSIVKAAMAKLGGTLTLKNRPTGGLEVELSMAGWADDQSTSNSTSLTSRAALRT